MAKRVYTSSQFKTFIEKSFNSGETLKSGRDMHVVCPACKFYKKKLDYSKRKLSIGFRDDTLGICHCWVCGYHSKNVYGLLEKYKPEFLNEFKERFLNAEELNFHVSKKEVTFEPVSLPLGFTFLGDIARKISTLDSVEKSYANQALSYLKDRGIKTKIELWYWKFGISIEDKTRCKYRIIIPSFDSQGVLSYWTARSWLKTPGEKYKNPYCNRKEIIFNELNLDWGEPLTIVEGPFDLFKCNQNTTCILGSELTIEYALMQKIILNKTPVVLAFDPEPTAQKKQLVLARRLSEFDIHVKIIEYKNNAVEDIGKMTRNEFIYLLQSAKLYSADYELKRKIDQLL